MKRQRHKREESFSLLLVSNTGGEGRQFHISARIIRVLASMLAIIGVVLILAVLRSAMQYRTETELSRKLAMSEQRVKQLEDEKSSLNEKNAVLLSENEALKAGGDGGQEGAVGADANVPSHYPYTGAGALKEQYSEAHPYISVGAQPQDRVIAAGAGTVTLAGPDGAYPVVIEVEHGNGYKSRYMCMKEAGVQVSVGQQVEARDVLILINNEETQLDYQVIYNEQAIDPLLVLEAKG